MKILILNQTFWPDVASTAQHAADLARELVRRGHEVTVLAGRRAYGRPEFCYPATELWEGVRIVRVGALELGKRSLWRRMVTFVSFLALVSLRLVVFPRQDAVLAMTSPPMIPFLAALFTRFRGGALHLWVMDLNPDLAVAAGLLRERSLVARGLEALLRYSLRSVRTVVVLDRFMKERIESRGVASEKIGVIAPWSHDDGLSYDPAGRSAFRETHGLSEKFVVMYSGNHSPYHPLHTLLAAAERLADQPEIAFCFVGGGVEFERVQRFAAERNLANISCLPYQPFSALSASLSAADLHVVVMGDAFVGIVHPCKIYNITLLGIPFLYIGPQTGHVTDLIPPGAVGDWAGTLCHTDVDGVVSYILARASAGHCRFSEMEGLSAAFSQRFLSSRFAEFCFPA